MTSPRYYISNRDGLYYRGTCRGGAGLDWAADVADGFAYGSRDVAVAKIITYPVMFAGCHVAGFGEGLEQGDLIENANELAELEAINDDYQGEDY